MTMHVIENAPIGFRNAKGEPMGVHWDYLTAIEKKSGICIKKKLLPYARVWRSLKYGSHDGGIAFRSPGRKDFVKYVTMIRSLKTVVIPRKPFILRSYQDLNDLRIGKTRGTQLSNQFDSDNSLNKIEMSSYDLAAKMIKANRLDAIAGSGVVLTYQLEKYDALGEVDLTGALILGAREQWLQLSSKSEYLGEIPKLRQAVEELRKEGVLNKIMTKYYGDNWKVINRPIIEISK